MLTMLGFSIVKPNSIGALIERDPTIVYVLGLLYFLCLLYAARQLRGLLLWMRAPLRRTSNGAGGSRVWLDTPFLLAASITFTILVRCVSFIVLAVLSLNDSKVPDSGDQSSSAALGISVTFSVGDFETLLTYLLLLLFWLDMLVRTHTHFFSQSRMRRDWLISYVTIAALLLLAQAGLIAAVFLAPAQDSQNILQVVFAVIGFLSLALPAALCIMWLTFTILMAGFPFRSNRSKRVWARIRYIVGGWTVGRIAWASVAIAIANDRFVDEVNAVGSWLFTTVVIVLYLIAEVLPFVATVSGDNLKLFAPGEAEALISSGGIGGGGGISSGMGIGSEEEGSDVMTLSRDGDGDGDGEEGLGLEGDDLLASVEQGLSGGGRRSKLEPLWGNDASAASALLHEAIHEANTASTSSIVTGISVRTGGTIGTGRSGSNMSNMSIGTLGTGAGSGAGSAPLSALVGSRGKPPGSGSKRVQWIDSSDSDSDRHRGQHRNRGNAMPGSPGFSASTQRSTATSGGGSASGSGSGSGVGSPRVPAALPMVPGVLPGLSLLTAPTVTTGAGGSVNGGGGSHGFSSGGLESPMRHSDSIDSVL